MYVGSVDWCATLSSTSGEPDLQPGKMYMGTGMKFAPVSEAGGWITALNSSNGKVAWHYKTTQPVVAGITPTAGGVIFGGDLEGNFLALDATSGKLLAKSNLGGALAGGIITYSADGHQYVATTAGNVSRMTFGSSSGTPRLVIMTTGLKPGYQPQKVTVQQPEEVTSGAGPQGGKHLYAKFCSGCHGPTGEGGVGPQLKNESSRKNLDATAAFIKNPQEPMPKLYPSPMSEQDVNKVAAYVQSLH
jgi:alcohol dehydrogenase (cytochrome c)